jgi:hypothetical protein
MSDLPPTMAAEMALTRQAVSLSIMRQTHDMEQKLVSILDQSLRNVPVSSSRGSQFNATA